MNSQKLFSTLAIAFLFTACQKDGTSGNEDEIFKGVNVKASSSMKIAEPEKPSVILQLDRSKFYSDNPFELSQVVTPSECAPTVFNTVINNSVSSNIDALGANWYDLYATMNFYYTISDTSKQYFGAKGEYTNLVTKITRNLEKFWNMPNEISVKGQHNATLNDKSKIIEILTFWYGLSELDASFYADYFVDYINIESTFLIETPLISFDGFAIALNGGFGQGDLIVIGDGLIELASEAGVDAKVTWEGIMAHEWGHQLQFNNSSIWYPNGAADNAPEATRTTELEADFFTGYYLTHKRGGTYNWKATEQFLTLFFNIGDCSFTSSGHHGTPDQRMEAARQGFILAQNAKKNGHILSEDVVHQSFLSILPSIVGQDNQPNNNDDVFLSVQ